MGFSYMEWAADVLRVMPARGIELAAFDLYKRLLSPLNQHYHQGDDAGWLATGLAGGAAGASLLEPIVPEMLEGCELVVHFHLSSRRFFLLPGS